MIPAVGTGRPSSETATMPALFISPISESSLPSQPFVMEPIGKTFASCARCACSMMKRVTAGLSFTGSVLGIAQMLVQPPATAAAAPLAIVSLYSAPRLAQVRVKIDETRRDDQTGRVQHLDAAGNFLAAIKETDDAAIFDQKILAGVNSLRRIDYVAVCD